MGRVPRCRLLTPFQEGTYHKLLAPKKSKFCKHGGKQVYWASEASPTLGCSIEISRDIYMYIYMSVCLVCQINCIGGIT